MKLKVLLFILLVHASFLVKAQQVAGSVQIANVTTAACPKSQEDVDVTAVMKFFNVKSDTTIQLVFYFSKPDQRKGADKKYKLKNLMSETASAGKLEKDSLKFDLGLPLQGADTVLFQLVNNDGSKCYQAIVALVAEEEEKPKTATLPALSLTPYTTNVDPCTSCSPEGNKIVYDFSKNSLKNSKTGSSIKRTFKEDYLKRRWTKLPKVGEELVFEVQNVNPFKYDITLSDEVVLNNTEAPTFLLAAFTPKDGIQAVSAWDSTKIVSAKEQLETALNNLNEALVKKIEELRNAGDCINPCSYIQPAVKQIVAYFNKHMGYTNEAVSLESFLAAKVQELYAAPEEAAKAKELNEIIGKLYAFRNSAAGTFSYRILQLKNVDQYLFNLNITPKPNVTTGSRVVNQDVFVDVLGGFKVDVSSGLFLTDLRDGNFVLRPDSSVIKSTSGFEDSIVYNRRNKIIQENSGHNDFGITSLFHFYPKITPHINVAFSLGAGVTLNQKPKLRYLGGASLLVGRTNRLALSYGWAFGFVDELSNRYADQKDAAGNIFTSINDTKVEINKKFDFKSFVSLTYSIPLFKKKEEVKPEPKPEEEPKEEEKKEEDKKEESSKS